MDSIIKYLELMRFHKPIGTLLLLWPTLFSLYYASSSLSSIDTRLLLIFILGTIVMRAAGCVINDYADIKFDLHVSRTKNRPLTSNKIPKINGLILFVILISIAFILVSLLPIKCVLVSIPAVIITIIYPFTKRFFIAPQAVLGVAFAISIPMVYFAVLDTINLDTLILFLSTICWVIAYDTQYAMVDKQDDLKIGLKSTAITFGDYDKLLILFLHLLFLSGIIYLDDDKFLGVSLAFLLILYQQYLIKDREPSHCFKAFLNNNYVGLVLFLF